MGLHPCIHRHLLGRPFLGRLLLGRLGSSPQSHQAEKSTSSRAGLSHEQCAEVAKPEWWNDEGLKALSARVVRAAPNDGAANCVRAQVLSGRAGAAWGAGPRSAAELKEAATHYERAATVCDAPAAKAQYASFADQCRSMAAGM